MVAKTVSTKDQLRAEHIIHRRDSIKADRGTYDSHVQEVAEYVVPRKSYVTVKRQEGQKTITFNTDLYDPTAVFANQYMAAGLISHLAPPNSRWFAVRAEDEELNRSEAVKISLANLTVKLHEAFASSNFYMQLHELMIDMGYAGMACMEPQAGKETDLNFKTNHISEFVIAENSDHVVDTIYYTFKYTARQAKQEWGKENLSKSIMDSLTSTDLKQVDKKFEFIQELRPREEYKSFPAIGTDRKIASTIVCVKDKAIIEEDGFFEMPKLTPRWSKNTNETNGRSQGMFAFPWIKQINKAWKDTTQARELGLRPPTLVPDDGFVGPIRSVPGAIWSYRKGLSATPGSIFTLPINSDQKSAMLQIDRLELNIKRAFFNDLFVMLTQMTKSGQTTAFEISERIQEKHAMRVPPAGRLQSELLNGVITRSIGVLGRAGKLNGIIAPELIGQRYKIEYISKLALALRILETRSITSTMDIVTPMQESYPVFDNFNMDKTARGIAERLGYPPELMNTEAERDEIRRVRQLELEARENAEMALEAGKVLPPGKEIEEGSPVKELAEVAV
jgi:hypothetical protein